VTSCPPPESEHNLSLGDFLRLFHEEAHWPLVAIKTGQSIESADFLDTETRESDASRWAARLNDGGYSIYFPVNPLKKPLSRKASKDDVLEARWIWADCDPSAGLSESELENWRRDKLAELSAGKNSVPLPTIIVDSGRGFWAFWRLRTPEPVDGRGPQTDCVESFGRGVAEVFDADAVSNIDRIARLPGFINHKTGRQAVVVEYHPERNYDLTELPAAIEKVRSETVAGEFRELIDDDAAKTAAINYLASAPPAIEHYEGRATTMQVLQKCMDRGCSFEVSIELMEEHWNDRCVPPWAPNEIEGSLRGLRRDNPIGCRHPAVVERESRSLAESFFELIPTHSHDPGAAPSDNYPLKFHGDPNEEPLKKWLLDKALPEGGVALFSGQGGSYKTFLAFDLAAAVIVKGSFAGRSVRRQGGVLLIAAEGQDEVRPRLRGVVSAKISAALKIPSDDRLPLNEANLPFAWCDACPRLARGAQALVELRQLVKNASDHLRARTGIPLALILIDTLMSAADLKDANDWAEAQQVMNLLRRIAQEFEVLILVVDHFGKDVNKGTAGADNKEASADAVLAALASKKNTGKVSNSRLAFRKVRGGKQGEEVSFSVRPVHVGFDPDGGIVDTLVIEWRNTLGTATPAVGQLVWPKKLGILRTALENCLSGQRAENHAPDSEVIKFDRKDVQEEFFKLHRAAKPRSKQDSRRTAFCRGIDDAEESGLLQVVELGDGVEAISWTPNPKNGQMHNHSDGSGTEAGQTGGSI
jgi:hypothetical protein